MAIDPWPARRQPCRSGLRNYRCPACPRQCNTGWPAGSPLPRRSMTTVTAMSVPAPGVNRVGSPPHRPDPIHDAIRPRPAAAATERCGGAPSDEHRRTGVRRRRHAGRHRRDAPPGFQWCLRPAGPGLGLADRFLPLVAAGHRRQRAHRAFHRRAGAAGRRNCPPDRAGASDPCPQDRAVHRCGARRRGDAARRRAASDRAGAHGRLPAGDRQHHHRGEHRRVAAGHDRAAGPGPVRRHRLRRRSACQEARARRLSACAAAARRASRSGRGLRRLGAGPAGRPRGAPVDGGDAQPLDQRWRLQRRSARAAQSGQRGPAVARRAGPEIGERGVAEFRRTAIVARRANRAGSATGNP